MHDLLSTIQDYVPAPEANVDGEVQMLITQTESNQYFGRQLIGRIHSGTIKKGDKLCTVKQDGEHWENAKVTRIIKKYGMNEVELD